MKGNTSGSREAAAANPNKDGSQKSSCSLRSQQNPEVEKTCKTGFLDSELRGIISQIPVGGLTPFTTIDFPGRLAGVFYLQGCEWRCRYCYNTEFWKFVPDAVCVPPEKILHFLESRRGKLDGIVFSGGEPTAHPSLGKWIRAVRSLGYQVALHTNGMYPRRLEEVLPFLEWVGLDIKAPFARYDLITQVAGSGEAVMDSLATILRSGIPFECRTTVHPDLVPENDILEIAKTLSSLGVKNYHLQTFRTEGCPDKELRESPRVQTGISANLRDTLSDLFRGFQVRE